MRLKRKRVWEEVVIQLESKRARYEKERSLVVGGRGSRSRRRSPERRRRRRWRRWRRRRRRRSREVVQ